MRDPHHQYSTMRRAPHSSVDHARTIAQHEIRIRALEASLALEQHRREEAEAKYARLKRKYARLYAALQDAHDGSTAPGDARRLSPLSSNGSPAGAGSPPANRSPRGEATRDDSDAVIDLTSPVGSRRTSLASPPSQASRLVDASDDVISESPLSPRDAAVATLGSATRRSARVATARVGSDPLPPPAPPVATGGSRVSGVRRRQLDFLTPDPGARHRPRLGPNPLEVRPLPVRQSRFTQAFPEERRRRRSPPREETKSEAEADRTETNTRTVDEDEAASIALAQYLQRQENLAAMQEYQEHLRALEQERAIERERQRHHNHENHAPNGPQQQLHDGAVDPDNMTYEELLQLGEQNGDVKKERWRQVAVRVISRLPTHQWTTKSSNDISCIICQYGFSVGDVALTLPCAHVFHEECVTGWVRENNSCPLCKLEIADV